MGEGAFRQARHQVHRLHDARSQALALGVAGGRQQHPLERRHHDRVEALTKVEEPVAELGDVS